MFRDNISKNAATNVKFGGQAHETRLDGGDQIIQNSISNIFMEMSFITKGPDIELETFEFNAGRIRDVIEDQRSKIGLAGLGTQTGKLRDFHVYVVIALGIGVGEGFQKFAGHGFAGQSAHFDMPCGSVRMQRIIMSN